MIVIKNKFQHKGLIFIGILAILIGIIVYHRKSEIIKDSALITQIMNEGEQIRLGSANATHTLTIFYDYSCVFCRHFFFNSLPKLENNLKNQELSILLKPVNLRGDAKRTEAYCLLYCLENYELFQPMHKILLLEPDYMYTPDFIIFKEDLFIENIDLQQCSEYLSQQNIIENNKLLLKKLGYSALPLFIFGNKALPGLQSAEKIKSLIH